MARTRFTCPYCGYPLGSQQGSSGRMYAVGPPEFECPHCHRTFYSGGREWVDIPKKDRDSILWERFSASVFYGIFTGVVTAALVNVAVPTAGMLPASLVGIGAALLLMWWRHNTSRQDIQKSLKRQPQPTGLPSPLAGPVCPRGQKQQDAVPCDARAKETWTEAWNLIGIQQRRGLSRSSALVLTDRDGVTVLTRRGIDVIEEDTYTIGKSGHGWSQRTWSLSKPGACDWEALREILDRAREQGCSR